MYHRFGSNCLQPHLRSRYSCVFNDLSIKLFRCTSSVNPLPSRSDQDEGTSNPETKSLQNEKTPSASASGNEHIFISNLKATLEAHRASNRAKIIRKISWDPPQKHDLNQATDSPKTTEPLENPEQETESVGENSSEVSSATDNERRLSSMTVLEGPVQKTRGENLVRRIMEGDYVYRNRIKNRKRGLENTPNGKEYEAKALQVKAPWRQVPNKPGQFTWRTYRPWLAYLDSTHQDGLERLSSEIRALEAYMRLTPAEEEVSRLVISEVTSTLNGLYAPEEIQLLGSRSTGLATPLSDLDFSIVPNESVDPLVVSQKSLSQEDIGIRVSGILRQIETRLRAAPGFERVTPVFARVAVIRAVHSATGTKVEFQTMKPFHSSQEQTKACLQEFPSLRPLFIAVRTCLEIYDFATVFEGGIGSYTLIIMIVTALKHANNAHKSGDLGGQLLHILDFWGSADLSKYAYSAHPPAVYEKSKDPRIEAQGMSLSAALTPQLMGMDQIRRRRHFKPDFLCLQDPADFLNDLGRRSYEIETIQAIFKSLHASTVNIIRDATPLKQRVARQEADLVNGNRSILYRIIRADFGKFEKMRSRIEYWADPEWRAGPERRAEQKLEDSVVSLEQQRRAIEYRERNGLKPLITKPESLVGDWHFALGVRYQVTEQPQKTSNPTSTRKSTKVQPRKLRILRQPERARN